MFQDNSFQSDAFQNEVPPLPSGGNAAPFPALESLLEYTTSLPAIGGFDAPFAFSLGLYGKPTSVASIIPQVMWHLRQQGNS